MMQGDEAKCDEAKRDKAKLLENTKSTSEPRWDCSLKGELISSYLQMNYIGIYKKQNIWKVKVAKLYESESA